MSALERPGAPGSARERYQRPGSAVGALGAGWERWERCWLAAGTWVGGSAGSARVGGLAGWEPRLGRGGSGALARERSGALGSVQHPWAFRSAPNKRRAQRAFRAFRALK